MTRKFASIFIVTAMAAGATPPQQTTGAAAGLTRLQAAETVSAAGRMGDAELQYRELAASGTELERAIASARLGFLLLDAGREQEADEWFRRVKWVNLDTLDEVLPRSNYRTLLNRALERTSGNQELLLLSYAQGIAEAVDPDENAQGFLRTMKTAVPSVEMVRDASSALRASRRPELAEPILIAALIRAPDALSVPKLVDELLITQAARSPDIAGLKATYDSLAAAVEQSAHGKTTGRSTFLQAAVAELIRATNGSLTLATSRHAARRLFPALWASEEIDAGNLSLLVAHIGDRLLLDGKQDDALKRYAAAWLLDTLNLKAAMATASVLGAMPPETFEHKRPDEHKRPETPELKLFFRLRANYAPGALERFVNWVARVPQGENNDPPSADRLLDQARLDAILAAIRPSEAGVFVKPASRMESQAAAVENSKPVPEIYDALRQIFVLADMKERAAGAQAKAQAWRDRLSAATPPPAGQQGRAEVKWKFEPRAGRSRLSATITGSVDLLQAERIHKYSECSGEISPPSHESVVAYVNPITGAMNVTFPHTLRLQDKLVLRSFSGRPEEITYYSQDVQTIPTDILRTHLYLTGGAGLRTGTKAAWSPLVGLTIDHAIPLFERDSTCHQNLLPYVNLFGEIQYASILSGTAVATTNLWRPTLSGGMYAPFTILRWRRAYAPSYRLFTGPEMRQGWRVDQSGPTKFFTVGLRTGVQQMLTDTSGGPPRLVAYVDVGYSKWDRFGHVLVEHDRFEMQAVVQWPGIPFMVSFATSRGKGITDNRLYLGYRLDVASLLRRLNTSGQ
jgi:hypothetical protein